MELKISNSSGLISDEGIELSDTLFARDYNESLVHQVVTAHLAGGRSGTRAQKSRAAVSGGGVKPWRQKGTGRARSGSIRSPIWRGGGVTFAASSRDFSQKINRKMYRAAMQTIVSELIRKDRLIVVSEFSVDAPKTRQMVTKLRAMGLDSVPVLIITDVMSDNVYLSSRNIKNVDVITMDQLDPVNLVAFEKVIITVAALKRVEELLA